MHLPPIFFQDNKGGQTQSVRPIGFLIFSKDWKKEVESSNHWKIQA